MFDTSNNPDAPRRRFGLTEAIVVVAILLLGGFTLVTEGHQTVGSLLAGYDRAMGG